MNRYYRIIIYLVLLVIIGGVIYFVFDDETSFDRIVDIENPPENYEKLTKNGFDSLEEIQAQNELGVIYINATWCGACKSESIEFKETANSFPAVSFIEVDLDNFRDLLNEYDVIQPGSLVFLDSQNISIKDSFDPDILSAQVSTLENIGAFGIR